MRRSKLLALAALCLTLAGCSLARPEAAEQTGGGDRFIGVYVVPSQGYVDHLANNPYLEEYGEFSAETDEFGTLRFPQDVLFAVEDGAGSYTFPGLEQGYSLFVYREPVAEEPDHKGRDYAVGVVSNMAPGEQSSQFNFTDGEVLESTSGTIYFGPPLGAPEDWDPHTNGVIWRCYQVYQTEDGRIYLNGHGNSFNGPMTHTLTESYTSRENGETVQKETVSVTVAVEAVSRLERLIVTQFDEQNQVLDTQSLPLAEELPPVSWADGAAWALVEEIGPEETRRTLYNVPGEDGDPVSHMVVLLDEEGMGCPAYLELA